MLPKVVENPKNFITQEAHARHGAVRLMYLPIERGNDPTGHSLVAVFL